MLDPRAATVQRAVVGAHVAHRVHARRARAQGPVGGDAAQVEVEPGLHREADVRSDANADAHAIVHDDRAVREARVQLGADALDRFDGDLRAHVHALDAQAIVEPLRGDLAERCLQDPRLRHDERDVAACQSSRRRELRADEPAAHHEPARAAAQVRTYRVGIRERAQDVHAFAHVVAIVEAARLGTGREHERAVAERSTRHAHAAGAHVEVGGRLAHEDVDVVLGVPLGRLEEGG